MLENKIFYVLKALYYIFMIAMNAVSNLRRVCVCVCVAHEGLTLILSVRRENQHNIINKTRFIVKIKYN